MNVHLANDSRMSVGGSWSFQDNLKKYAQFNITDEDRADIILISGVTTVTKDTFRRLKTKNKKIVIRHDGIPEQHRNPRIKVGDRMKNWSQEADGIIYQSYFSYNTIGKIISCDGTIIYNGVDTEIFNTDNLERQEGTITNLYVYWREDPNKRPDEIIVRFREMYTWNNKHKLLWVGKIPDYLMHTNMGFFNNERYEVHIGPFNKKEMAYYMKRSDTILFPSFADTAPNTLIEALHCGCEPKFINTYSGTHEYVRAFNNKEDLSAKKMAERYEDYFKRVLSVT